AHTCAEIAAHVATLPVGQTGQGDLDAVLDELVAARLMLREEGRYLSLAVPVDYQVEWLAERHARRLPSPASVRPALARLFDRRTPALTARFAAQLTRGAGHWQSSKRTGGKGRGRSDRNRSFPRSMGSSWQRPGPTQRSRRGCWRIRRQRSRSRASRSGRE